MIKLDKPLYHGTSAHSAILIYGGGGFRSPVYLTENYKDAEHYAKSATAYLENYAKENNGKLFKEGYAIFTFIKLPEVKGVNAIPFNQLLITDDYNPDAEKDQWVYKRPIKSVCYSIEYHPLEVTPEEHLSLQCFAIGMWRA